MLNKECLRREIISKRKSLDSSYVNSKSKIITNKLLQSPCYKSSKVIYCYISINNEVNLKDFIVTAIKEQKIIAVPKVINNNIVFYQIKAFSDLKEGAFHIQEPYNCKKAPMADLLIAPGVAFSLDGKRLGYGGGYYDRFLSEDKVETIGVSYNFQIIKDLPMESHDIKLNKIITD